MLAEGSSEDAAESAAEDTAEDAEQAERVPGDLAPVASGAPSTELAAELLAEVRALRDEVAALRRRLGERSPD